MSVTYVIAQRNRDMYCQNYGKLGAFKFQGGQRTSVNWFEGQVRVKFPSWAIAQKAVNQIRSGDSTIWDTYVIER